jgi:hypothetical protein
VAGLVAPDLIREPPTLCSLKLGKKDVDARDNRGMTAEG